jgi:hypothetical protein
MSQVAIESPAVGARLTEDARAYLRKRLKPGGKIYLILRRVSRSGLTKEYGVVIFSGGEAIHPNHAVARLIGCRINSSGDGFIVPRTDLPPARWIAQELGAKLWDTGFCCLGSNCPANVKASTSSVHGHVLIHDGIDALRYETL